MFQLSCVVAFYMLQFVQCPPLEPPWNVTLEVQKIFGIPEVNATLTEEHTKLPTKEEIEDIEDHFLPAEEIIDLYNGIDPANQLPDHAITHGKPILFSAKGPNRGLPTRMGMDDVHMYKNSATRRILLPEVIFLITLSCYIL